MRLSLGSLSLGSYDGQPFRWRSGKAYSFGDRVRYGGKSWLCIQPGTSSTSPPEESNAEDIVNNGNFSSWTGNVPDGWSVVGDNGTTNTITNDSERLRITSDGTGLYALQQGKLSKDEEYDFYIDSLAATGKGCYLGTLNENDNWQNITSTGSKSGRKYSPGVDILISRYPGGASDCTVDNVSIKKFPAEVVDGSAMWRLEGEKDIICVMSASLVKWYIPSTRYQSNKYIEYNFYHQTGTNTNVWRLYEAYEVVRTGAAVFTRQYSGVPIVNGGAWDLAVKETAGSDFVGSYHGYEELSSATLTINGNRTKTLGALAQFSCREIKLEQSSTIYSYGTSTPIATRTKTVTATTSGISYSQTITWLGETQIDAAYGMMLPIKRKTGEDNTGEQLTDTAIIDGVESDVSEPGFPYPGVSGATDITVYGKTTGISARAVVTTSPGLSGNNGFVTGSTTYNKIYFALCTNYTTTTNEEWNIQGTFNVTTSKA